MRYVQINMFHTIWGKFKNKYGLYATFKIILKILQNNFEIWQMIRMNMMLQLLKMSNSRNYTDWYICIYMLFYISPLFMNIDCFTKWIYFNSMKTDKIIYINLYIDLVKHVCIYITHINIVKCTRRHIFISVKCISKFLTPSIALTSNVNLTFPHIFVNFYVLA